MGALKADYFGQKHILNDWISQGQHFFQISKTLEKFSIPQFW